MRGLVLCLLLISLPSVVLADCKDYYDRVKTIAEHYIQHDRPLQNFREVPDMATARCIADKVVEIGETQGDWGPPVGYKVGLTSKAMQEKLGVAQPVWGRLTQAMLRPEGELVPANYAARPIVEADLLVTIADAGINEVTTPEEAAKHVSAVTPFIELADLVFAEGEKVTAERIVAINVGATLGIVGESRPMTPELAAALPQMYVAMTAYNLTQWRQPATVLMGHPLQPLVWLVAALQAEGRSLQPGDVVSLGSFGPPLLLTAEDEGESVTVSYKGASGTDVLDDVSVTFSAAEP
jgi:2-keto-4-pentenoate hydratase